jgi:hypothetical protein
MRIAFLWDTKTRAPEGVYEVINAITPWGLRSHQRHYTLKIILQVFTAVKIVRYFPKSMCFIFYSGR